MAYSLGKLTQTPSLMMVPIKRKLSLKKENLSDTAALDTTNQLFSWRKYFATEQLLWETSYSSSAAWHKLRNSHKFLSTKRI